MCLSIVSASPELTQGLTTGGLSLTWMAGVDRRWSDSLSRSPRYMGLSVNQEEGVEES